MVRISGFHPGGRGSIPRTGDQAYVAKTHRQSSVCRVAKVHVARTDVKSTTWKLCGMIDGKRSLTKSVYFKVSCFYIPLICTYSKGFVILPSSFPVDYPALWLSG